MTIFCLLKSELKFIFDSWPAGFIGCFYVYEKQSLKKSVLC